MDSLTAADQHVLPKSIMLSKGLPTNKVEKHKQLCKVKADKIHLKKKKKRFHISTR